MRTNFDEAESYIENLSGAKSTEMVFQTFTDDKASLKEFQKSLIKNGKNPYDPKAKVLIGNFSKLKNELQERNEEGSGIFVTVNETDKLGRTLKNVTAIRTLMSDKDDDGPVSHNYPTSMTIRSARGPHDYWLLQDPMELPVGKFTEMQHRIAHSLGTDKSISDASRVMRLPGFVHQKSPESKFLVRLESQSMKKFSLNELEEMFPVIDSKQRKEKIEFSPDAFRNWVSSLPTAEGEMNELGGRNKTAMTICREGIANKIKKEELQEILFLYCKNSNFDEIEAIEVLEKQIKYNKSKPFQSYFFKKYSFESATALARRFIDDTYGAGNLPHALLNQNDFYTYENGVYKMNTKRDLKADMISYFQKIQPNLDTKNAGKYQLHVEAILYKKGILKTGISFDSSFKGHFIVMKNGVVLIPETFPLAKVELVPHDPSFFSTVQLPYEYDIEKTCPTFESFLKEMLPDLESQELVYEWFGYNCIPDTSLAKAVVFFGEGANGKTVLTTVLGELLGENEYNGCGP